MWLPGHLAVAFLICLPLLYLAKQDRLLALVYVAFFSQLPDFLHFGDLRMFSHSIFGMTILILIASVALWVLFKPRPLLIITAVVATIVHILTDIYVGSISPFYPWTKDWLEYHMFNTPFDIGLEVVLMAIAFSVFVVWFRPRGLLKSIRGLTKSAKAQILLLIIPFGTIAALEGGYFTLTSFNHGIDPARVVLSLSFILLFVTAMVVVISELSVRPRNGRPGLGS